MLNKVHPSESASLRYCVPTAEIEHLVCNARNAAHVAAGMMEFIHTHHGVPDEIIYSVYAAAERAQELYDVFNQQADLGLRTSQEAAA